MRDSYNYFLEVLHQIATSTNQWIEALKNVKLFNLLLQLIIVNQHTKRISLFILLGFALSACGERRATEQQRSTDMETMGTDGTAIQERERPDAIPSVGGERVIDMEAKDHVYFPREIIARPGEQFYINLINGGNEEHNIHIDLAQAPLTFGEPVPVGQSRKLLVSAPTQPGRYQIFCPVKDHRQRGMIATLIVEQ